jgi:membrane protein YdbS with pleckstrin-like domain
MTSPLTIPTPWLTTSIRYRVCVLIQTGLPWLGLALAAILVSVLAPAVLPSGSSCAAYLPFAPLAAGALTVGTIAVCALAFLRAGSTRYQLLDDEVRMEAGILSRTAVSLPYDRIQTVTIQNGALDRMLGVRHVVCRSAADTSSITLPGLTNELAERTRQLVLERATELRT